MYCYLSVFAVVTLVVLAIGALNYDSAQQGRHSNSQFGVEPTSRAISEESLNNTYLLNEISALSVLVGQLNSDTHRNFSHLRNTVSSFISTDIRSLSSVNQGLQSLISINPSSVSNQISRSASSLSTHINSVSGS